MKRIGSLIILLALALGVSARKSYVTVTCYKSSSISYARLSGDIPAAMSPDYMGQDFGNPYTDYIYWIGNLLNLLSAEGFEVEQMHTVYDTSMESTRVHYLLAKEAEETNPANGVRRETADGEEVREVARYNLQGLPVSKKEKGIQIIVYSNYTTQTVLIE